MNETARKALLDEIKKSSDYEKTSLAVTAVLASLELVKEHGTKMDMINASLAYFRAAVVIDCMKAFTKDWELLRGGPNEARAMLIQCSIANLIPDAFSHEERKRERFFNLAEIFREKKANG